MGERFEEAAVQSQLGSVQDTGVLDFIIFLIYVYKNLNAIGPSHNNL